MSDTDLTSRILKALGSILMCWEDTLEPVRRAPGGHATVAAFAPLPVSAHILDVRAQTRARMAGACRMVIDERDLHTEHLSGFDVIAMADLIDRHAEWLAQHQAAAVVVSELEASASELRAISAPHRKEWQSLGTCPLTIEVEGEHVGCTGTIRAYPDADPYCDGCRVEAVVAWWEREQFPEMGVMHRLVTAPELITFIHQQIGRRVAAVTIRQWLNKGIIESPSKDSAGRNLYDKREVIKAFDSNGRAVGTGRHTEAGLAG